ncbi:MAG: flagellar hook-basal body protein [Anaerovoracaceae bacterium]
MNIAFYNASVGAVQQQKKLDVTANNIANINTEGYKNQTATFVDMMYGKIHDPQEEDLTVGAGARVEKTDISFDQGPLDSTGNTYDFAIKGTGFFAVYNMETQEISYTRKGIFQMSEYGSDIFYLTTDTGEFVLSPQGQAVRVTGEQGEEVSLGVYDFNSYQGMLAVGDELYQPVEKNGQPFLNTEAQVLQGYVEKSNASLADEMVRVIAAQRAYQANLRMVTTSDQIEQTVNSLR